MSAIARTIATVTKGGYRFPCTWDDDGATEDRPCRRLSPLAISACEYELPKPYEYKAIFWDFSQTMAGMDKRMKK